MNHSPNADPLLASLLQLGRQHSYPLTAETALAGMPLEEGRLTPQLAVRVLQRAGLQSRHDTIAISNIPSNTLPVLLLLEDDESTLLLKVRGSRATLLNGNGKRQKVDLKTLNQRYRGEAIVVDGVMSEPEDEAPSGWFWKTLLKGWPVYSESILASLLINLFTLAIPLFVMNVYDRVVPNDALETLWVLALGALLVISFDFILRTLRAWFIDLAGKWSDLTLSSYIFEKLVGTRMDIRSRSPGAVANHMREFEGLRDFFTSASLTTLIDLPFLVISLLAIWIIGGPIVMIPLLAVPIVLLFSLIAQIPMHKAASKTFKESTEKHAFLVETLAAAETVKSENAELVVQRRWEQYVEKLAQSGIKSRFWASLATNFTSFSHQLTTVLMVIFGVHLISDGEMSVGALIACTILSGRALAPLSAISSLLVRYRQSLVALKALHKLMGKPVDRPATTRFLQRPEIKGEIEFRNVHFHYPEREENALTDLSFTIQPGEHVALIGRIGSGKSTLQKLLLGLYTPQEGAILVDNTHLGQIDPDQLRRSIGYVSQEIVLFKGTLRENISFGNPQSSDEEILEAARLAGIDSFADHHPEGYDMEIGERGEGLSGGQRQAIAMARALLATPPIILLDEPTSAMDQRAEKGWKERMTSFLQGRTLILVTHRSSLLSLADRLIVLEDGKVVADSPREQHTATQEAR